MVIPHISKSDILVNINYSSCPLTVQTIYMIAYASCKCVNSDALIDICEEIIILQIP